LHASAFQQSALWNTLTRIIKGVGLKEVVQWHSRAI